MRAGVSTVDLDARSLLERVREYPEMLGADLSRSVSAPEPYEAGAVVGPATPRSDGRVFRIAAYDWGIKRNILRLLAGSGCEATVFPAATPAESVFDGGFDGVFLSNGPGDPAATRYAVEIVRRLLGRIPVFGICLGHQIVSLAAGGRTYKLKFGHRGANQPVLNLDTGRVEVTSHNHGFAVTPRGWSPVVSGGGLPGVPFGGARGSLGPQPGIATTEGGEGRPSGGRGKGAGPRGRPERPPTVVTEFGRAALTHWNLNDGTLEGIRFEGVPAFTVQYHPEAAPGPHDSRYLFGRFVELMERA
jgi:carbamoyl-phosphate synthase small subunit